MFLASIFVYSYFVKDTYSNAMHLKGVLLSKEQNITYYKNVISKIQSFMSKLNNDSILINKVSLIIPKKPNIGYFTSQIVELATINGLTIDSLSTTINPLIPSKVNSVYSVGSITATLKAKGSYAGLKSFAKQIKESMLIMDVSSLSASRSNSKKIQSLGFNIIITSYYQVK